MEIYYYLCKTIRLYALPYGEFPLSHYYHVRHPIRAVRSPSPQKLPYIRELPDRLEQINGPDTPGNGCGLTSIFFFTKYEKRVTKLCLLSPVSTLYKCNYRAKFNISSH